MVRQARAEITRDTVLSGAANVFLRLGYANAGLSEIISQSQVTKGALYFHFGSKEELARAVIDEGNSRLVTACKQFNDGRIPALEAAIGISYIVVDMSVSDPMVSAMLRLSHQIGDYRGTQGNVMAGWSEPATSRFPNNSRWGSSYEKYNVENKKIRVPASGRSTGRRGFVYPCFSCRCGHPEIYRSQCAVR